MNMQIIALPSVIIMHIFVMSPPLWQGALSDDARLTSVCLASVCLSRTCLSRKQIGLAGTAFLVIFSLLVNRSSLRLQVNLPLADIPIGYMPAFHFHSFLLMFLNLWPIPVLCMADI